MRTKESAWKSIEKEFAWKMYDELESEAIATHKLAGTFLFSNWDEYKRLDDLAQAQFEVVREWQSHYIFGTLPESVTYDEAWDAVMGS